MNTSSNYVRMNVSLPKDLVKDLKTNIPARGISKFMANATREEINRMKREKALKEILAAPPAFTFLKGKNAAVRWVRKMRREDNKRLKRIWGERI